jgi:hypothetical protein
MQDELLREALQDILAIATLKKPFPRETLAVISGMCKAALAAAPSPASAPASTELCGHRFLMKGSHELGIFDAYSTDVCELQKGHTGQHRCKGAKWGRPAPTSAPSQSVTKRLKLQGAPTDAEENLADYLLRNQPPTWDYATILRLAKAVATGTKPTDGLAALVAKLAKKFTNQVCDFPSELREWREVRWEHAPREVIEQWFRMELEAALAARESVRERVLAYVRANYSYLNTLPEALEKIFDTYGIPADLDKLARR